jgi:hypothetical protein
MRSICLAPFILFKIFHEEHIWTAFVGLTERPSQVTDPNLMDFEYVNFYMNVFTQLLPELSKIQWQDFRQL